MRLLFEIDTKDYDRNGTVFERPSARGIIIKDGKIAMIHSLEFDYYKFPGGGMEAGEDSINALIREVREEAGLVVVPETVKEYGMVHRIQKGTVEDVFIQDNYYYLCEVETGIMSQRLDDYEAKERFTLEFVTPQQAVKANEENKWEEADRNMLAREAKVLEILIKEGYFGKEKVK